MSSPKTFNKTVLQVVFFYTIAIALIISIRLSNPYWITTGNGCNLSLARREATAFLNYNNSNFIQYMPKTDENLKKGVIASFSSTTNARNASTSKTERLLKQLSEKIVNLQRSNEEKDRQIHYLRFYIARNSPTCFSYFEENHPIDSQDWEKLYKLECQLNNI